MLLIGLLAVLLGVAAAAQAATVTVAAGDTLSGIAARNGTTVSALAAANGISNPNVIVAGRRLVLPGTGSSGGGASYASSAGGRARAAAPTPCAPATPSAPSPRATATASRRWPRSTASPTRTGSVSAPDCRCPARRRGRPPDVSYSTPSSSSEIAALLERNAARYGVPLSLARAIAWQESRWNQSARSHVGAVGVMQLMPATARWFGPAVLGRQVDPSNVSDNIETGVAYLGWLLRNAGDTRTAIGGYYQGLSSLKQRGPYDDTTAYINSVVGYMGRV